MKKYYIKQKVFKITDHYAIMDENQNEVYYVDQDFKLIGNTVHVSDRNKRELFTVERQVLSFLPKYFVRYFDGREITLQSQLSFLRRRIDIDMDGYRLNLKGRWGDFTFEIFDEDVCIGEIKKGFLTWGDTFEITIFEDRFEDIVIGLVIAVDNIQDMQQNS